MGDAITLSSTKYLFAGFILFGILLEKYELNRSRFIAIPIKKTVPILTSLISTALVYGLFIILGYVFLGIIPPLSTALSKIIAVGILLLAIAYSILRDKRYSGIGKMIYGNFRLFILITIGRGVMHIMTGFLLALLKTPELWLLHSYLLGVALFGIGVILAKGERVHIFGISVGYIKILSYTIAGVFILLT